MLHARCHVSRVTFFWDKMVKLVGGGSVVIGVTPSSFIVSLNYNGVCRAATWPGSANNRQGSPVDCKPFIIQFQQ